MRFRKTILLLLIFALEVAKTASAAEILVPDQYTTITTAVAEANPGDTIVITDSGIYDESLVIQKADLAIRAASGTAPTIRKPNDSSSSMVFTEQPIQFGSSSGGRIVLDGNGYASLKQFIACRHPAGTTATFENLEFKNPPPACSFLYPESGFGNEVYRNVKMVGNGVDTLGVRCDFVTANRTLVLDQVRILSVQRGLYAEHAGSAGTVDIIDSEITGRVYGIHLQNGSAHTLNINRSAIHAGGDVDGSEAFDAVYILRSAVTINAFESVFLTEGDGNGVYLYGDTPGNPYSATFDHCDLIGVNGVYLDGDGSFQYGFAGLRLIGNPTDIHRVTVTNSIVWGFVRGTFNRDYEHSEVVIQTFSNVYSPSGIHSDTYPLGTGSRSEEPHYNNFAAGDMTYSNSNLLTADDRGGPVGSNRDFDFSDPPAPLTPDEIYINAFNTTFPPKRPPSTYEQYITSAPYNTFIGQTLTDAIAQMEAGDRMPGNGFGHWMESLNHMYLHTGDLVYIRENLRLIRAILNYRDDVRDIPLWDGNVYPVWGTDRYTVRPGMPDAREAYSVDDGLVMYPVLWFLKLAKDDSEAMHELASGEFEQMTNMILETLQYYDERQYEDVGVDQGHMFFHQYDDVRFEGDPQPANWQSSIGRSYWMSWLVTGNLTHHDRALRIARYSKARIRLATDGAYYWPYWFTFDPVTTDPVPRDAIQGRPDYPWIEDVSHGALTASFWILMAENDEVFDETDMLRISQMVKLGFGRLGNGIILPNLVGDPILSQISLTPNALTMLPLSRFDPDVYDILARFAFTHWPSPGPLHRALILRYHDIAGNGGPTDVGYWLIY